MAILSDEQRDRSGDPPSARDYANAAHDILKDVDPAKLPSTTDELLYAIAAGILSIASSQSKR